MTKEEQMVFVAQLADNVVLEIAKHIDDGAIPEQWDGIELRQYMADKFAECVIPGTMSPKRRREYKNTVIVNNL